MFLFGKSPKDSLSQYQLEMQKYQQQYQQQIQQLQNMAGPFSGGLYGGIPDPLGVGGILGGILGTGSANATAPPAPKILPEEFVVSAISGWRKWTITLFGKQLHSNNGTAWVPFQKLEAACGAGSQCRGVDCGCGIYAYKNRKQLVSGPNAAKAMHELTGEVWLWGRIVEHKDGYRAQFAYPKSFINSGGLARELAEIYKAKLVD